MHRVIIIGCGGSGKSTLARRLAPILGLPLHHLDALHWKPGWTPTPRPEWRAFQERLVNEERWIIDGNYNSTLDIRMAAADTVIYLDMSRYHCIWGAIKRYFMHRKGSRPDRAEGCDETLDLKFLLWLWHYPKRERPAILAKLEELRGSKQVIHLRSRKDVERFVASLPRGVAHHMRP